MPARRRASQAIATFAVLVAMVSGCGLTGKGGAPTTTAAVAKPPPPIPAVESGLLPWSLRNPLSRAVALPGPGTSVLLAGGLDSSNNSTSGLYLLDTTNGSLESVGKLPAGVHDAAGAQVGGVDYFFGGGSPATVANVVRVTGVAATPSTPAPASPGSQATVAPGASPVPGSKAAAATEGSRSRSTSTTMTIPAPAPSTTTGGTPVAVASSVGSLPAPRSDSVGVTVGNDAYVVGGYDGTNPDAEVLATSDGVHFAKVAALPVPVRYPAVAALGGVIYVFGGELVGGTSAGQPNDAIQAVDTAHRTARIVGHLDEPLAGASAFVLGGHVYVAGGVTQPPSAAPAVAGSRSTTTAASIPETTVATVEAFDPTKDSMLAAGTMPRPVAYAAAAVVGEHAWIVGGEVNGSPVSAVEMVTPNAAFGTAGAAGAGSPYFGSQLLVADRGNNRILLLDDTGKILWTYPSAYTTTPPGGFYFPDDAFFAKDGTEIISNQEQNETIVAIAFPSGKIAWQYGHPKVTGSAVGFLNEPDDAYLLKNGQITVADAYNCRILFINPDGTVASQIGTTGSCVHDPPKAVATPNGDTPLADGNFLISEINGSWVSEYTPQGAAVWSIHLPISYPSDPQQIGPDLYLISDYSKPGGIFEFNREGQILYRYQPASGPGELDHPSLTELLPSGVFLTNDDYRDRMVAVDPSTQALVWQYGVDNVAGTAPGQLNTPDGFDIRMPDGSTPTHPYTG